MEKDRTAAPAAIAVALSLLLAALPARAEDSPACDDCKFLPCVQSELTHYRNMQKMYLDLATRAQGMDMDAFTKLANEESNKLIDQHNARIQGKAACQNRYPPGLLEGDYAAQRKWASYGFGLEDLGGGKYNAQFSAVTDPIKCELRERQLHALQQILACTDLAVATRKHEEKHVADCRKAKPATPAEHARFEAAGYAEGIKELQKSVNRIRNKRCPKPQPTTQQGPKAQEAMKRNIDGAAQRLQMYAAAKAR